MIYEQIFLKSLLVTLIIEVPVVFFIAKYLYQKSEKWLVIFTGIIASTLTLPYLWFILPVFISERIWYIVVGELLVLLIETIIYQKFLKLKFTQALIISFVANLASFLFGFLL